MYKIWLMSRYQKLQQRCPSDNYWRKFKFRARSRSIITQRKVLIYNTAVCNPHQFLSDVLLTLKEEGRHSRIVGMVYPHLAEYLQMWLVSRYIRITATRCPSDNYWREKS
ncbi:hypothetical protein AVEN_80069-1 [Araneus ventricosus]|uniref:Uncharacterized protein n=1 Tax=Araneus ventricosus TaxID=182803 RepID=A0A4Y2UWV3_ARAVE|nr:hypothetical protein AVEN_80069-1 [Araneus ventricosus]